MIDLLGGNLQNGLLRGMKPFEHLSVWQDPMARSGPENMAVDELLLREEGELPLVRFYQWAGAWVSVGYFGEVRTAQEEFGDTIAVVQRWTGGGIVDHRRDLTYTLVIPYEHPVARMRGGESYSCIHAAVVEALLTCGISAEMTPVDGEGTSSRCFDAPVAWDVMGDNGRKLAGAGQRRTRWGLLHQGSVQLPGDKAGQRETFTKELPVALSRETRTWTPSERLMTKAIVLAGEKYEGETCGFR